MSKPVVAVVGRPNVGKSTFFNKIIGRRVSIVEDTPGVTRDRIYAEAEWNGINFGLIDTGGIEPANEEIIPSKMRQQAEIAIDMADVVLFMVDGKEGLTNADHEVAEILRRRAERVILVVNKIDTYQMPDDFYDFYELGLGEPIAISAANMLNFGDLLDEIVRFFPEGESEEDEDVIKIAVNKWDLVEKETNTMRDYKQRIYKEFPFMPYAVVLFISVLKHQRVGQVLDAARAVAENRAMRVPTGKLNSLLQDAVMMKQPPSDKGKRLKIYYVTQVGVKPPLFSFQINKRDLMHFSYSRYLENKIREAFGFEGTPVKFVFREKGEKDEL
jgi:small GTP-binding protein